jgi:hypothetical protein
MDLMETLPPEFGKVLALYYSALFHLKNALRDEGSVQSVEESVDICSKTGNREQQGLSATR